MFLVEKVLAKSNMYTRYVLYLIGIAILSFSFIKRNTIIHNLVRHSTEMKKFLPSHQKKTPLGPCSQRVAASCVAREPQHQQNINKSSPAWSPVASGFSMLRVWWRIGKPKAKVLPLLESFRKSMSKTCQANLRSRGGGGGESIKRNSWGPRSFILFTLKKLMSPKPQLQNLKLPILHPKSPKKRVAPRLSCANHIFPLTQRRQQASRLAWSKLRSGEPLPKIKWTQHRWFLAHPADLFFL